MNLKYQKNPPNITCYITVMLCHISTGVNLLTKAYATAALHFFRAQNPQNL